MKNGLRVTVALVLGMSGALSVPAGVEEAHADRDSRPGVVAERPRDAGIHAVDGEVRTVAQVGGTVVIGGSFTRVGPVTLGAVGIVDTASKTFAPGFPDVVGAVRVAIPDGSGGWYLGGSFSSVGGVARTNLAQVDSAGQVTSFDPAPNGAVRDLATTANGDVVAAGDFSTIAGQTARGVARLDPAGLVWGGSVTGGSVRSVALSGDGSLVYVGGDFSQVGGVTFRRLAALDAGTGVRNTTFAVGTPNQPVNDIVVRSTGEVLITGSFTAVGGIARVRLANLDGTTGALGALNISINNTVNDLELDDAGNVAYLAGTFGSVGGVSRNRLAGVNLTGAGSVTSLALSGITGDLSAVTLDGSGGLYLGGSFQITPERDNPAVIARVALATNAVTSVVPYYETPRSLARTPVSGTSGALALVRSGGSLLVAGDFSDYGVTARSGLAAYDLATGALRSDFNPAPDGQVNIVKASANAQAVFVGGEFLTIAGEAHSRIAKLDIGTGNNVPGFGASANSYVKDMAVRTDGSTLYVGGNFDAFNGVTAQRLVAIDPTTGATLAGFDVPLTEPTNDMSEGGLRAMALSPDETRLMVIGNFRKAAGADRPLIAQVAVDQPVATVTDWRSTIYDQPCARSGKVGFMRDVDIDPDGQTAYVVSAGHFYYPACDTMNAFPMAPGGSDLQPIWSDKIGDTIEAVAADQDAVYMSGHFRYLETETRTEPRFQIAAVDPDTGDGINWVPNAGGFRGVLTLELEPAGLFSGSDGDAFGGVNHGRNAYWPTPAPGIEVRKAPTRPWVLAPSGSVAHRIRVQNTFSDRSVTVTGLTDARMGNLDGSGTCSLPQLLGPGEMYSCTTASETVSGVAPTDVRSTVTATASASGTTITDTDTSVVQVIASAPTFRLRTVVGPGQVAYPGSTVRFGITTMNLDLERSATVTSLTSPTFGNVSSECGLPRVVGPNQLVNCHLDRFVTGSVGSKPSFSFTATAAYDTGNLTSTSSATVTINPPIGGTKVLAVVANTTTLSGADKKVTDFVEDNYSITYADDDTVQVADVLPDYSYVIVYPSAVENRLGTRLRDLQRPVMVLHSRMLDEMGMAAVGGGAVTGTSVSMVTPMHPLSVAKAGTQTINKADAAIGFATPTSSADIISEVPGSGATEFAYTTGAPMAVGTAPACRVFFNGNAVTQLTTNAWTLFNRAAAYAAYNCGKNMLWTAAGSGSTAYSGDGCQSVACGINTPWGLAIDSQDRVYFADSALNAVRRINSNGTVTTIAGTGTAGSTGDGGPATAARLSAPVRLAFDPAGNLYIADSGNNKIRKVTPAGIISTVAGTGTAGNTGDGGQATAARLRTPYDMAFGPDGSMYIADRANHKIRRVAPNGVISTFAGTGSAGYNGDDIAATSARLNSPYGVDVDADGNVYIADFDNERVRKVDANRIISTFAGTGVATIDGDGGPAVEAGLHKPQYVHVTPSGDVYIGESNNNRVRLVHDGSIDTVAGSGQFGYVGDGGSPLFSTWSRPSAIALDSHGNLWVADRGNRRIRVINAS
jgi:sugar lactone lactonase YvrE